LDPKKDISDILARINDLKIDVTLFVVEASDDDRLKPLGGVEPKTNLHINITTVHTFRTCGTHQLRAQPVVKQGAPQITKESPQPSPQHK
jgi:hypothetical protein